jgi:L-malate glycosyltransferase
MKIAIVCYPTHGGSGVVASELAIALAAKGHQIHIVSYATPFRLRRFYQNIFIHEVEVSTYPLFKYPPYELGITTKLVELCEEYDLDLVHSHYAIPHAASAYFAKQIVLPRRLKTITTLHGTDITLVGADPSFYRVIKFAIEQSDGVTAVSRFLKDKTCELFDVCHQIRVIPNFIAVDKPGKIEGQCVRQSLAPAGEKILLHASNFRPVKRLADVVRIFAKVRESLPAKLVLVGEGPEQQLVRQMVHELKLEGHVHFLGEQDQIEPILFCSDLFLLPSEQESFGLSALEAMNCGVPVIGTAVGGLPEVVADGQTGYLLPLGATDQMAARAVALLRDAALYRRTQAACRLRAAELFDAERIIPQYEAFYQEILGA